MNKFISTRTLCELYEVSKDFYEARMKDGELQMGVHFVKKSRTIRWNYEIMKEWWNSDSESFNDNETNSILNKIL